MGRPKGELTEVARLPLDKVRKIRFIAKKLNIQFKTAWERISGARVDDIYRRMKAGEHIELGETGA